MDKQGKIRQVINTEAGLHENIAWFAKSDRQGGLWVALNNGISRIEFQICDTISQHRSQAPLINSTIFRRSHPRLALEDLAEVLGIFKSKVIGDLADP